MEFDPFGNVHVCCANTLYPLGNVSQSSVQEIWLSRRAEALRDAVGSGDLSLGCVVCEYRLLHPAGEVPLDYYAQFPSLTDGGGWPRLLTFNLHNTCNLACIMCGPDLSSRIRRQRTDLAPVPHFYDDSFFEDIVPFLERCESIDMAGGEPFLVREHRRVLELVAELPRLPDLSITTNGTIWNDYVEWVLDTFAPHICVSIDALTGPLLESIRVGASFDRVVENIERFLDRARSRDRTMSLSFSMLRHNWFELGSVLSFAEERGMCVSVQTVHEREFGVQWLDTPELEAVVRTLESEGASIRDGLVLNGAVWDQQLLRLRSELDERVAHHERPPTMLSATAHGPDEVDRSVRRHLTAEPAAPWVVGDSSNRLRRWTGTAPSELTLGPGGEIISWNPATAAHGFGVDTDSTRTVVDFLRMIEATTRTRMWTAEEVLDDGVLRHTLWFSRNAHNRDRDGMVVQLMTISTVDGGRMLVAVDDYLLSPEVPVTITRDT